MSEELQVAVVAGADIVVVPEPQIDVLVDTQQVPIIIESPELDVVTLGEDVTVVDERRETTIITVGEVGPPGPAGPAGGLPAGTVTGDVPRYNSVSGQWEAASEPIVFKGLILTPTAVALTVAEGAIFYNSGTKTIDVCTSAV